MGYCEDMREMIGDSPLIIVRPSVAIINDKGEILLSRNVGGMWTIPGGTLQLIESVEECITRMVFENIGLKIKALKLFGVYSGKELLNRVDERYHTVAIGYLCTEYEGEITLESVQGIESRFFRLNQLPDEIEPYIKNKLFELKGHLK
ncbi:NUDIX domain-containing protein [Bacillus sp. UNC438CL73TsuS30]|uniref:NUDIX domain-containing protein n=1 Tax=Bacillus sp. UNC438CL73TsuS30 TaxID=1340434 RepID=UPI00047D1A8E|nr:NUDIX domain-containing protein [Bacillus sp. UNC438CL73TsuS30]